MSVAEQSVAVVATAKFGIVILQAVVIIAAVIAVEQFVTTGPLASFAVKIIVQVAVFPTASVTVKLTICV